MCGICGFYQFEAIADGQTLKRMNDRLTHRGPDDEGFYFDGHVGLAARRLSIIDLETGHQPLPSQSEAHWITYNGEVYNFQELRDELSEKGYIFKTKTDTEVIVNLYEEYGIGFVKKLRGMFAIGIYDKRNDRLILVRDHNGVKPLYYCLMPGKGNLVFGSEIKAILEYPGVSRDIDNEALDLYLTLEYIPSPFSIFKAIRKLPSAHYLIYDRRTRKLHIEKYWDPVNVKDAGDAWNLDELKEKFRSLLKESVKMRMIADVPLGAFLSGGLDSSSIVAMMSGLSERKIKTFSIGFEEKSYSELAYSARVSEIFGTEHYTKELSPNMEDLVLELAKYWDEPMGDFSNFPTYLVSKIAREHVTVALSGDGGDEIFGGYEHYVAQKLARFIDFPLLRPLHPLVSGITHLFPPSELKKGMVNRVKRFSEGFGKSHKEYHLRWMIFLSGEQKRKLYSGDFLENNYLLDLSTRIPFREHFENSRRFEGINRDLYLDLKTYMIDDILVKVDRMSMATSLEARVPLLDYKMVEFAFSLPSEFKVKGTTTKWFFKKAMEGILPDEIIYRQKEGFSIPIKRWLKNELKNLMMEYLSEPRVKQSGYFHYPYIQRMMKEHLDGKRDHSHRLWALIQFFIWKERF